MTEYAGFVWSRYGTKSTDVEKIVMKEEVPPPSLIEI